MFYNKAVSTAKVANSELFRYFKQPKSIFHTNNYKAIVEKTFKSNKESKPKHIMF